MKISDAHRRGENRRARGQRAKAAKAAKAKEEAERRYAAYAEREENARRGSDRDWWLDSYDPYAGEVSYEYADWLTRELTGQRSFRELAKAGEGGYQPTFCGQQGRRDDRKALADFFDQEMILRGSPIRAHRCHW